MSVEIDSKLSETLPFEQKQQDAILGYALNDRNFLLQIKDRIKAGWFVDGWTGKAFEFYVKFFENFGHEPKSDDELFLFEPVFVMSGMEKQKLKATFIRARNETNNYSLDVLRGSLTGWLKSRIYHQHVSHSATLFNNRKFTQANTVLEQAVKELQEVAFEGTAPVDWSNPQSLVAEMDLAFGDALTLGHPVLDRILNPDNSGRGSLLPGDATVFLAPTNVGKCLHPDTEVILHNGTVRTAKEIVVGDLLMGPDGLPRTVLSTTTGNGPMFKVTPKVGGRAFICNDVHVLSLKKLWKENSTDVVGDIVNLPLDQFLKKSDNAKRQLGLWRPEAISFQEKELLVPAYILGLWLGDGHSANARLTTIDKECVEAWGHWVGSNGDAVAQYQEITYGASICDGRPDCFGTNSFNKLKALGVIENKHIPQQYLTSSESQRLELLAGLIDSDGHFSGDHSPNFEITQKNAALAKNIAFLARSLGFKVTESQVEKADQNGTSGKYTKLCVLGTLSKIPVRLSRKKAVDGTKNPLTTGFTVESVGIGDYAGFTLDGDHLFLLGDFTVTHNTTAAITVLCNNLMAGKSGIFVAHEGRRLDLQLKIWQSLLNVSKSQYRQIAMSNDPKVIQMMTNFAQILAKQLVFIHNQKPGNTVEEVVSMVRQHQQRRKGIDGKGFDLFVDDYPALLGTEERNVVRERRQKDAFVYRYLTDYVGEQGMHGLFSIQTNRDGSKKNRQVGEYANKKILTSLEDVQEAYEVTNSATTLITLNASPEDQVRNLFTFLLCKSRSSITNVAVACRSNMSHARTHDPNQPATWWTGTNSLDQLDSLLVQYSNQEVPYNYKDLRNDTSKS